MGNLESMISCTPSAAVVYSHAAVGDLERLKVALKEDKNKIGIKYVDGEGKTPLMIAAKHGHTECVTVLLNNAAKLHARSNDRTTVLLYAISGGHEKVIEVLLKAGANVNARGPNGQTALMRAALLGHSFIVAILLQFRAYLNTEDIDGVTPLMAAVHTECEECLKLLLHAGADKNYLNKVLLHKIIICNLLAFFKIQLPSNFSISYIF